MAHEATREKVIEWLQAGVNGFRVKSLSHDSFEWRIHIPGTKRNVRVHNNVAKMLEKEGIIEVFQQPEKHYKFRLKVKSDVD